MTKIYIFTIPFLDEFNYTEDLSISIVSRRLEESFLKANVLKRKNRILSYKVPDTHGTSRVGI